MKKSVKRVLTLLLALAMTAAIGTAAFADDAADAAISLGFCGADFPVMLPVDAEDGAEATINGISYAVRVMDGYMFVRQGDVAKAALISENLDLLGEVGLDVSQIYIKHGMILIKEDGLDSDEIAALYAKLDEFCAKAELGLLTGTEVEFTCGGEVINAVVTVENPAWVGLEDDKSSDNGQPPKESPGGGNDDGVGGGNGVPSVF